MSRAELQARTVRSYWRRTPREPWRPGDGSIGGLVGCIYCLLCLALIGPVTARLDPVTGDEPFYLVTAGSILRDGDINEINNWCLIISPPDCENDVERWLPPLRLPPGWQGWPLPARNFPPHASQTIRPGLYSKHGLGVPILILPALWLNGGRLGVVLIFSLIGALVAMNIYWLARAMQAGIGPALGLTAALGLTNPLLSYSFLIFPELPAALLTIYAFRRLLAERNNGWQALTIGLAIAGLPWLHARLALIALVLGAMALVRIARRQTATPLLPLLVPAGLSALGLIAFYWYFYDRPWPNTQDHAGLTGSLTGWLNGLFGLLLDQQWGLLIHAPVYLLTVAGAVALLRQRPGVLGWLLLVVAPYYLFIGAYNQWWGEWCPPARYLTTLVPLAAAPLAALWARDRTWITAFLVAVLSLPGLAVMLTFLANPQLMYNHPTGESFLLITLSERGQINFTRLVPSFVLPASTDDWLRLAWLIGLPVLALLTTLATYETAAPPGELSLKWPRRG